MACGFSVKDVSTEARWSIMVLISAWEMAVGAYTSSKKKLVGLEGVTLTVYKIVSFVVPRLNLRYEQEENQRC